MGDVIGDLNQPPRPWCRAMDDSPSGKSSTRAAGNMFGYATPLRSMSQGRATFTMEFDHYAVPKHRRRDPEGDKIPRRRPRVAGAPIHETEKGLQWQRKFERTKPHVNVGRLVTLTTARRRDGGADEGDGGATAASSGVRPDRRGAGREGARDHDLDGARGIRDPTRHYAHVDCPGHADYVKNMITGAAQMDGAILVVSAADGPMPQTREHILLARQVGVPYMVVFLNKGGHGGRRRAAGAGRDGSPRAAVKYEFPGDDIPIIRARRSGAGRRPGDRRAGDHRWWTRWTAGSRSRSARSTSRS